MQAIQEKMNKLSTDDLKTIARELMAKQYLDAPIELVLDVLEKRMKEEDFVKFCDQL